MWVIFRLAQTRQWRICASYRNVSLFCFSVILHCLWSSTVFSTSQTVIILPGRINQGLCCVYSSSASKSTSLMSLSWSPKASNPSLLKDLKALTLCCAREPTTDNHRCLYGRNRFTLSPMPTMHTLIYYVLSPTILVLLEMVCLPHIMGKNQSHGSQSKLWRLY